MHTQHVESYSNWLKYSIKDRKGINIEQRKTFLSEFVFREHHVAKKFYLLLNNCSVGVFSVEAPCFT